MTVLRSLVPVGLTGSQWLLPWMSILLGAVMTYAMIGALNGSWNRTRGPRRYRVASFRSSCHRHPGLREGPAESPWFLHLDVWLVQRPAV